MRKLSWYLSDMDVSDVSRLSGAKPDAIKNWVRRKQIDAPPIGWQYRNFSAEHTWQVIIMKMLTDHGIVARKAGPRACKLASEAVRSLDAGESPDVDGLPIWRAIRPHIEAWKRGEADHAAWWAAWEAERAQLIAKWEKYGYPKPGRGRPMGSIDSYVRMPGGKA